MVVVAVVVVAVNDVQPSRPAIDDNPFHDDHPSFPHGE